MAWSKKFAVTAGILFAPLCVQAQVADTQDDLSESEAVRIIAGATGFPLSDVQILQQQAVTLPNLGTSLEVFKVRNPRTDESVRLAIQGRSVVDYEQLLRDEEGRRKARYGSMQLALHRRVTTNTQTAVQVLIKMNASEPVLDKAQLTPGRELEEAATQAVAYNTRVEDESYSLLQAALRDAGVGLTYRPPQTGPFVQMTLAPSALLRLAQDGRVGFLGLNEGLDVLDYPTIPQSLPTTQTDVVHAAGAKGAGVKIAILEGGTLNVPAACFNIGATQDAAAGSNDHMTKSAGIIGNRYSVTGGCNGAWQGYAPEATVLLANKGGNCSGYADRYKWAKAQGANVITMSWHCGDEETDGDLHARDVFFDHAVAHFPWPSVFTSAGNQSASDAFASGKGFNFFGVGNVANDGDGNRCNDTMTASSTWKDPTSIHGDREVPAIASPGSRHDLLGTNFGGTSAATPVTASIATVLMSAKPALRSWPEAVRAILLATANYQNTDGATWSKWSDGKDGTGMTNTKYAHWAALRRETTSTPQFRAHDYGSMTASSFSGGYLSKVWKAHVTNTNSRVRVALTWNSKTGSSSGTPSSSQLDADLDLYVYDADGNQVATSSTWDSSHEFVEFTPKKTGSYTIKVRGFSVPSDFFSYYGVAWTTHYDLCAG
ncbi:S8 family serine peptidase [Pyxidicoccus trucidator]|uniref:S8 family serine peptidase n=1 Tax=Pyxidicoccus trucidator TaxID=2709662 RepID=UPI0013D946F5|nr:S8 family serine peptidase [Pyxidicoccus trucidator]